MDLVENDRRVVFVVEDNMKKKQDNLKHIEDEIVEDVMEDVEVAVVVVVVDEKYVELVMMEDI